MGQDEAREDHIDRLIENKSEEIDMSVGQIVEPSLDRLAARDFKRLSIEVDRSDSPSRANSAGELYRDIPAPATDVEAPHPGDDFNSIEKRRRRWRKDASQNAQPITALFPADMNVVSLRHRLRHHFLLHSEAVVVLVGSRVPTEGRLFLDMPRQVPVFGRGSVQMPRLADRTQFP
jgi:hypothetical protein